MNMNISDMKSRTAIMMNTILYIDIIDSELDNKTSVTLFSPSPRSQGTAVFIYSNASSDI